MALRKRQVLFCFSLAKWEEGVKPWAMQRKCRRDRVSFLSAAMFDRQGHWGCEKSSPWTCDRGQGSGENREVQSWPPKELYGLSPLCVESQRRNIGKEEKKIIPFMKLSVDRNIPLIKTCFFMRHTNTWIHVNTYKHTCTYTYTFINFFLYPSNSSPFILTYILI